MKPANRDLIAATLVLCALITLFHVVSAWFGHSIYRDQHLGTALLYAKNGIDLLRPVIVGFTAADSPVAQEIPIWQAAAALAFKCFGTWFGWANVVSLLFFFPALWPLFQMARTWLGERGAWWTLVFFLAQPNTIFQGGRGGTDGLCIAFAIWFVYFADGLLRTGQWRWFFPAALFAALAALSKAPFFMAVGGTSFFLLLLQHRASLSRWVSLGAVGLFAALCLKLWTRHTDAQIATAEFPFVDLRLSNPGMWFSYFGNLHFFLSPWSWARGGWRALNCLFGSFALVGLALWGLLFSKNRLAQLWFAGAAATTCVFFHAVLWHQNYFLIYGPAVALLCAPSLLKLEELAFLNKLRKQTALVTVTFVVLLLAAVQGLVGMKIVADYDSYPQRVADIIQKHTSPQERLLIWGGGWGGNELILSHRGGLNIWNTDFLDEPKNLARLKSLGYTKLVMVSESPLMTALQVTDPGDFDRKRMTYHSKLTGGAREWKTIYESDDILIKEVPGS